MQKQYDRRHFIRTAGASLATLTVGGLWTAPAQAQGKLTTSDPVAQALHFDVGEYSGSAGCLDLAAQRQRTDTLTAGGEHGIDQRWRHRRQAGLADAA